MPEKGTTEELCCVASLHRVRGTLELQERVAVQQRQQHGQVSSAGLRKLTVLPPDQQDVHTQRQLADQYFLLDRIPASEQVVHQPRQQRMPPRPGLAWPVATILVLRFHHAAKVAEQAMPGE